MNPILLALLAASTLATPPAVQEKPGTKPDEEQALYGVGLAVSRSLGVFSLSPAELDVVIRGMRDGLAGKPKYEFDERLQNAMNELAKSRKEAADARQAAMGPEYLKRMKAEPGARTTSSGAVVIPLKAGTGASPSESDKVKVSYVGKFVDGREFDRGEHEFPLNGVIKCWTEAVQLMRVGGRATIVCPSDIAYGPAGRPGIPGNAVLTFDVNLLAVEK